MGQSVSSNESSRSEFHHIQLPPISSQFRCMNLCNRANPVGNRDILFRLLFLRRNEGQTDSIDAVALIGRGIEALTLEDMA